MKFFIQDDKGNELGPYTLEAVKDMAESGQIHEGTLIRNSLMKRTQEAKKLPSLKGLLKDDPNKQKETKQEGVKKMAPLSRTKDAVKLASKKYRTGALLIDAVIIYAFTYLIIELANMYLDSMGLSPENSKMAATIGSAIAFICASVYGFTLFYYTFTVGFFAQTFGQRYFGIMAVTKEDEPVLLLKAFFYSIFFIITLPVDFFFLWITKKSLHEMISGTKIVNVRLG